MCCFFCFSFSVDHSRVALAPREGIDGSDFINANYIAVRTI